TLTYDGTTLTEKIHDNTSGGTFTTSFKVNIASVVGGKTACVGFTGATGALAAEQDILKWQGDFGPVEGPLSGTGGVTINAVEGQVFTATVATFTGSADQASIDWGDGTTSAGTISGPNGNGVSTVTGTHTYAEESKTVHGGNPFTITVTIKNNETSTKV